MIFLTVGTQLPFDRLVAAVDRWAGGNPGVAVAAQVGPTPLAPRHIEWHEFISPAECRQRIAGAELVVAHAGMGTILTSLELGTPVLIMPRQAALGEHRNDHQIATARWFAETGGVSVAFDEAELVLRLGEAGRAAARSRISEYAPDAFINALRTFIGSEPQPIATL
ncbi:MAG TPA: glycosyltransferase [Solirubrobacteraceae bacterium]|nr:glycosyltransferase [Solirubrobacteraceae bacterium]